ncbi:MAG: hypothetical protein AB7O44_27425 [Hyphomicrobiaceae bacterium]
MLLGHSFAMTVGGGGASFDPAPVIEDAISFAILAGADPAVFLTAGLEWESGERVLVASSFGSTSVALSEDPAGSTDDTADLIADIEVGHEFYLHEVTVNGGALDAGISYNLAGASRGCWIGMSISGMAASTDGYTTPAENSGSSGSRPISATFNVPDGPRRFKAVAVMSILGAHVAFPPDPPAGYTLVATPIASTSNNPGLTSRSTLAVAVREYDPSELAWPAGVAAVPQADWLGLEDWSTQAWHTYHFAVLS